MFFFFVAFSQVLKKNLVLDVISNAKYEISNQRMVDSTIALNANNNKIQ
jgi:hypothetical protein